MRRETARSFEHEQLRGTEERPEAPAPLPFVPGDRPGPCGLDGRVVQVTVFRGRGAPALTQPRNATLLMALLRHHPRTLAACIMPDRLHWLLDDGRRLRGLVWALEALTARKRPSCCSYRVVGDGDDIAALALHIAEAAVRGGLVTRVADYPYQFVAPRCRELPVEAQS